MCYFSLTEKYFIVYQQNTEIVGQIDAPELCKAIVNTYNKANFLIDAFRINNWYLDRGSEHERRQSDQYSQKILESTKENLIKHAANLKLIHQDLKSETGNLFARIAKYLAEHPAQ